MKCLDCSCCMSIRLIRKGFGFGYRSLWVRCLWFRVFNIATIIYWLYSGYVEIGTKPIDLAPTVFSLALDIEI